MNGGRDSLLGFYLVGFMVFDIVTSFCCEEASCIVCNWGVFYSESGLMTFPGIQQVGDKQE